MNADNFALAGTIVDKTYVLQAQQAKKQLERQVKVLLSQRTLPKTGWTDATIKYFLAELSAMDSNNFLQNVGGGEREGRIFSDLVRSRHFGLAHGVGRSGDVKAVQPKAAGSSLLYGLTNMLALHALKLAGFKRCKSALVLPLATGMALSLTLRTLHSERPKSSKVIWLRIDQKSALKCIMTSGLEVVIVHGKLDGDRVITDLDNLRAVIEEQDATSITAVLSTASCFAPRACDSLRQIGEICAKYDIPHVVNNAYGVQASWIMHQINEAARTRLDFIVQSTDKNFMVPVGGSIVSSPNKVATDAIAKTYSGRASASPIVDLFITLLSMGSDGFQKLIANRKVVYDYLLDKMGKLATSHGQRILKIKGNPISIAMSLEGLSGDVTYVGSMLFKRCVTGIRVVVPGAQKTVNEVVLNNWGASDGSQSLSYALLDHCRCHWHDDKRGRCNYKAVRQSPKGL